MKLDDEGNPIVPRDENAERDELIGRLTRDNGYLKDSAYRREQWLDKAKRDAGYDTRISFDIVWKEVLAKARKFDETLDNIKCSIG